MAPRRRWRSAGHKPDAQAKEPRTAPSLARQACVGESFTVPGAVRETLLPSSVDALHHVLLRLLVQGEQLVARLRRRELAALRDRGPGLLQLALQGPRRLHVEDALALQVDVHRRGVGEEFAVELVLRLGVGARREPGRRLDGD